MQTIIITGGLGTGKSSVSHILEKQSYPVLSADVIINDIYQQNSFKEKIAEIFSLPANKVSKSAISNIAFHNQDKLHQLEGLLYPELSKRVKSYKEKYKRENALYLFYEAPVFFEKNLKKTDNFVLVVSAKKEICLSRLLKKGMSEEKFNQIFELQMPIKDKEDLADYVVINNSSKECLEKTVADFIKFLKKKYANN